MKKKLVVVLAACIIIAAVAAYLSWKNQSTTPATTPTPSPTTVKQQLWQGVSPGISFDDLVKIKGAPKQSSASAATGDVSYPGTNKFWDTTVSIRDNKVLFIREHVFAPENVSFRSRKASLSEQPTKLYGQISESGQFIYVFPSSGIAFLVNDQNDKIYEVWYFEPTTLEGALSLPALSKYSTDPNTINGGR